MDSRVAAMVADILFEVQRSENNMVEVKTFCPPSSFADIPKNFNKFEIDRDCEKVVQENGNLNGDADCFQKISGCKATLEQKENDVINPKTKFQTNGDSSSLLKLENDISSDYNAPPFLSIMHHINGTNENIDDKSFFKVNFILLSQFSLLK